MTEKYEAITAQMEAVLEKEWPLVSNLSNAAGVLYQGMENINWAGFYLLGEAHDTPADRGEDVIWLSGKRPACDGAAELWLGPFQGKPACVRIDVGKGVCGTAAFQKQTLVVEDVRQFPGHIACDSDSRSEIVIPLVKDGKVIGVLDIDSPVTGCFTQEDREGLEAVAEAIGKVL